MSAAGEMKLYEIAGEYAQAVEKLADLDLPPEVIADTLEALGGELQVKANSVAGFILNLEKTAEAIKAAEAGLAQRRKAIENRAGSIKAYLKLQMEKAGVSKIESPMLKLTIKKNPPAVEIVEQDLVPLNFYREPVPPPPSLDTAAIKADLAAGLEVPGARLAQSTRLEIR